MSHPVDASSAAFGVPSPRDPLRDEVEAFLCRSVAIPGHHALNGQSRLKRDLHLGGAAQRDVMERFFAFFRVARGDYDARRDRKGRSRPWPWRRVAAAPDITVDMLVHAVRVGRWNGRADGLQSATDGRPPPRR